MPSASLFPTVPLTPEEINGPELWRPWPRDTRYSVSTHGRALGQQGQAVGKDKNSLGYVRVCIRTGGLKKMPTLHRMIAEAFIPNTENLPLVRHLNDVKADNHVRNLAWGTQADNNADAWRNNRFPAYRHSPRHPRCRREPQPPPLPSHKLCRGCGADCPASGYRIIPNRYGFPRLKSLCRLCENNRRKIRHVRSSCAA